MDEKIKPRSSEAHDRFDALNEKTGKDEDIQNINNVRTNEDEEEVIEPRIEALVLTAVTTNGENYSSFSQWQKGVIVFAATAGSFFSPFTTQIFFPALTSISHDLHVSNSKVNITVTTYMILQAIAPAFIGNFSDTAGRRPAFIICFTIYIIADIALALQNNYIALLILRMLQSGGSSGTVALANAIVADIATSSERGVYIGATSMTAILAPSLGPVLGGIISEYAGWHWIFWFLAIFAAVVLIPLIFFMPETCRMVVGDGSVPPPKWNRSLMNIINEKKRAKQGLGEPDYAKRDALAKRRGPVRFPNPMDTLAVAFEKEGFLVLFYAGIVYAGFYAVMSGMPSQLADIYGYGNLTIGLMFLPMSGGSFIAAVTQGRIIDWSFRYEAKRLGLKVRKTREMDLTNFPIEKARLQVAFPLLVLACFTTIIYGWLLHFQTNVAGPCIVLFVLGYTFVGTTQSISVLIVDINPLAAGTATAAFNLIRCLLGAGATAVILPMTAKMGLGWSYTFIGLIYVVLSPMLWGVIRWGPEWRMKKKKKDDENERLKRDSEEARERL